MAIRAPDGANNLEAEKSVPEGRGEVLQEDPFTIAGLEGDIAR